MSDQNSVYGEIREQRKKLKGQGFKAHWEYFWEYYKIHFLVIVGVIIMLSVLIRDVTNNKPYGFYAMMINSSASMAQDLLEKDFVEYAGIDTSSVSCFIDTSPSYNMQIIDEVTIATSQKIMANISAAELDVIVGDSDVFSLYANQETLLDLRTVLSPEQIEKYSKDFFYVDQAYLDYLNTDEYQSYVSTGEFDHDNKYAVMADRYNKDFIFPDSDPAKMENPIPVGIKISSSKEFESTGAYRGNTAYVGIVINTTRPELAVKFIDFIIQ